MKEQKEWIDKRFGCWKGQPVQDEWAEVWKEIVLEGICEFRLAILFSYCCCSHYITGSVSWISLVAQQWRTCLSMQETEEIWFNPWVRKISWKRKWQPTSVSLPGKSHGQRSLVGYSSWDGERVGHDLATKLQQQKCPKFKKRFKKKSQKRGKYDSNLT